VSSDALRALLYACVTAYVTFLRGALLKAPAVRQRVQEFIDQALMQLRRLCANGVHV
jgi:hypothetical protein